MVLHEKGVEFETREVDLQNKSEEFLGASPTGKVPVTVVEGDSIYESNVINQFLDETLPDPLLMPKDPHERAHTRIWMSFADDDFFPSVFGASVGRKRGFTEERVARAKEKLEKTLDALEARLAEREYLAGDFSLADIAYAGNFVRLRKLEERGDVSLDERPNVAAWMRRIEARESYERAL
jgi:glutathione S-transferase